MDRHRIGSPVMTWNPLDALVVTNYADERRGGASRQAQALARELAGEGYAVGFLCRTPITERPYIGHKVRQVEWGSGFQLCKKDADSKKNNKRWNSSGALGASAALTAQWIARLLIARGWTQSHLSERLTLALLRTSFGVKYVHLRNVLVELAPKSVVSFITNANVLVALASWDLPIHVVTSERVSLDSRDRSALWDQIETFTRRRVQVLTGNTRRTVAQIADGGLVGCQVARLSPNILRSEIPARAGTGRRIVYLGRLVPRKRVHLLISAFKIVAEGTADWELIVAGEGAESTTLRQQVHDFGIEQRVRFLGFVDDVPDLLANSGILVLTSTHEGTPNSVIEAMTYGIPCVIPSALDEVREIVVDGPHPGGVAADVEDTAALAGAILELAVDENLRRRLGSNGRRRVEMFEWKRVRADWLEILNLEAGSASNRRASIAPSRDGG